MTSAALSAADCPAGYNVVQGTSGNNVLNGTAGSDCILGLGGNDTINGSGGDDFLIGGLGNDTLRGGDGNDVLHGEEGADRLEGQNHDDTLYGGVANDNITGGNGNDLMYGGDADDIMDGNAGDDSMWGGAGSDEISGSDGNDRIFGEADDDYTYGDGGDDIIHGGDGGDECWAGEGHDVVTGGAGVDLIVGDGGNDFIADGGSNVFIHGGDADSDSCVGFSCELPPPTQNGCTVFGQCAAAETCVADVGMCVPCGTVGGVGCNTGDDCPSDPDKTEPGICGCGVADTDSDSDGVADCNDVCNGFDDTQDADQDGTPDGCEHDCPPGTVVHIGDVTLQGTPSPAQLAALDGVECITGSVTIETTDLIDLSAFSGLQVIEGDLTIDGNAQLASVEGLRELTQIDGWLEITDNDALLDLNGLEGLTTLGADPEEPEGFLVAGNAQLAACWEEKLAAQTGKTCQRSLTASDCVGNAGTGSCAWQPAPNDCVPGATGPGIYDGYVSLVGPISQSQKDALAGITCITGSLSIMGSEETDLSFLASLEAVGDSVAVQYNDALASLSGLESLRFVRGSVMIDSNSIANVDGLQGLRSIGGGLQILGNLLLTNLEGLGQLESLGPQPPWLMAQLYIGTNYELPQCWVEVLEEQLDVECGEGNLECDYNLGSGLCSALPPGFECEPGATGPAVYDGDVFISSSGPTVQVYGFRDGDYDYASFANGIGDLTGIECVTGVVQIDGASVTDVSALTLSLIGGDLYLFDTSLSDLEGLDNVTSIAGQLAIGGNNQLTSLDALGNLASLAVTDPADFDLLIYNNAQLNACWVAELEGQTGTTCGASFLSCNGNNGTAACP